MLSPDSAHLMFLGHFNPYLISPAWLAKEEIWVSDDAQLALAKLGQDSVRFKGGGVEWMLSFDRMSISSATSDCGALALEILNRLPHTPVSATVANFSFQVPELTLDSPSVMSLRSKVPPTVPSTDLLRWSVLFHEGEVRVDLTLVTGEQGSSIAVNRHRKTESVDSAKEASEAFIEDKRQSCVLAEELIRGLHHAAQ